MNMALSPKLELRQGQGLVMTPQLQQAIKLLQLSHLDLGSFIENELEQNPLLERGELENEPVERRQGPDAVETGDRGVADKPNSDSDMSLDEAERPVLTMEAGQRPENAALDANFENVFPDDKPPSSLPDTDGYQESGWASMGSGSGRSFDGTEFNAENMISREPTLKEHLGDQLSLAFTGPVELLVGKHLIDLVDESGYLRADLETLSERLGATRDSIEEILSVMQGFEPLGVFARDLSECLAIQLREKDRLDPAMQALLDNIELLAKRDLTALKSLCRVDDEDLTEMVGEIRSLNPKPGNSFGDVLVQPIIPDVIVRARPDGSWHVELNAETLPKVLVNKDYYANVSSSARTEKEQIYFTECLQSANWLVKSLDQRAKTILKVGSEIVRQQDGFLAYGVQQLKPLTLRVVAEAISMHESTVSRVTSNKYIETPRGIFELKYFFTSAIPAAGGGQSHSAEAVRQRIKGMIDGETLDDILSDDQIVRVLKAEGVEIARRTVAKYRESLRLPSSVQRRREKRSSI